MTDTIDEASAATDAQATAERWFHDFDAALTAGDVDGAAGLFLEESFWRDLVSFTWNLKTVEGPAEIADLLKSTVDSVQPSGFAIAEPPTEADGVTEAWFTFETAVGRGRGLVRIKEGKAWTLLTTLVSVALTAPLMGGYLRVIHASEQGLPARAADILAPFRDRQDAKQLMTFALVVLLIQLLVAAVLGGLFREVLVDLQQWMERVMTLSQEARTQQGKAPPMPPLPEGTGGFLGIGSLLVLFIGGVFAVGLGQLTLARRGVRGISYAVR